mgnify:CR=1 FL=1
MKKQSDSNLTALHILYGGELAQGGPHYEGDQVLGDGSACTSQAVGLHIDLEPLVGSHHGVLDGGLPGPDQGQHPPNSNHGVQDTELESTEKEVYRLQDVCGLLGAEQLGHDGEILADDLAELDRVGEVLHQHPLLAQLVLAHVLGL